MKLSISPKIFVFLPLFALAHQSACFGMGGSEKTSTSIVEEGYVELVAHQPVYEGTINYGDVTLDVDHLSFGGKTTLDNVSGESDVFKGPLDLAVIKKIEIIEPNYSSQKNSDQEFTLVNVTYHKNDVVEKGLLFPRKLNISGIDKKTGRGKGAFIFRLKEIIVKQAVDYDEKDVVLETKVPTGESKAVHEESMMNKAKHAARQASDAVLSYARKAGEVIANAVKKTTTMITGNKEASDSESVKE